MTNKLKNLIYDRTALDVLNAKNNPSSEEFLKGNYNYTDLNRIEEWCNYLQYLYKSENRNVNLDLKIDKVNYNEFKNITYSELAYDVQQSSNLFNYSKWYENKNNIRVSQGDIEINENSIVFSNPTATDQYNRNTWHMTSTPTESSRNIMEKFGIEIESSTKYTISYEFNNYSQVFIFFYTEDGAYISSANSTIWQPLSFSPKLIYSFTTPSNAKYLCVRFDNESYNKGLEDTSLTITNIMLAKGTNSEYEEYKKTYLYYMYLEYVCYGTWKMLDIPTLKEINRIRENINLLKNNFVTKSILNVISDETMNFNQANILEQILNEINELLPLYKKSLLYCGTFSSGEETLR